MAYTANLTVNQQLTIINQGIQTVLSLISHSPRQQQSQTTSFTTGSWQTPPQLYQTGSGFVLQVNSQHHGTHYLLIQANSISTIAHPSLDRATPVDLRDIPDPPVNNQNLNFETMPPMQPIKMGNMSMDLNSMSMQMGNMSMNLGSRQTTTSAQRRFCSQCGQETPINARFCGSCGHKLSN